MEELFPNEFYHIYNRGNNSENVFYQAKNYLYFLKKYSFYLSEYLDTYAFCLMPNHFHLLVKIKEECQIDERPARFLKPGRSNSHISQQFSNFFNSYTKSINKQQNRHGSLFEKPFKRKKITNDIYLKHLIWYIHKNPVHHGFVKKLEDWNFSSYHSLISYKPTQLQRNDVLEWFDGKENYQEFHQQEIDLKKLGTALFEE